MKTERTLLFVLAGVSTLALCHPALAQVEPGAGAAARVGGSVAGPNAGSTEPVATQDPANAAAEDDSSADIVVTAQRRAERVTDVPISITVADQAQLERQQVNSISDLARIAPSLEINTGAAGSVGGGGAIRGIGTQTFAAGAQPAVGIVVDQVAQGNVNISELFDVARIEVLKGPQGTLFGLTTSAGVINITTNAPDPSRMSMRVMTQLSNEGTLGSGYGQQVVAAVANVPVAENAALRLSGQGNHRQGVNRNTFTDRLTQFHRYSLRGRFLWEPTDALTVNVIGDYADSDTSGNDFFTFITNSNFSFGNRTDIPDAATLLSRCGVTVQEGNRDYCTNTLLRRREQTYGASLQADYDLGPAVLTSISSYRGGSLSQNINSIFRADVLPAANTNGPQIEGTDLYTQEIRLSSSGPTRLEYTVGGFFSHFDSVQQPRTSFNLVPGINNGSPPRLNVNPRGLLDLSDRSYAAFGQVTFNATDALRLIAGGRFTRAELSFVQTDATTAAILRGGQDTEQFSYRGGVQYDIGPRTMAYATVNRGFKGGQITVPSNSTTPPVIIRPEIAQAYEIGVKSTLFRSWVLDLSAFHTKVDDFQAQECRINPATGGVNCQQINVDYILSRGAEINLFGRVTQNLTLNTGFIYAKTTYAPGVIGIDGSDMGGEQVIRAPRYKFTMSGQYDQPIGDEAVGFVALDTVWKSRVRYQQSLLENESFRPHWLVGGRIGVKDIDNRFTASIFARNLFNVPEPVALQQPLVNSFPNATGAIYGPASFRQIGISLDARF